MAIITFEGIEIDTNSIAKSDMPNELFTEIFELCGAETAVSLLNYMAGNIIHVPTRGMNIITQKIICKEFDGSTASLRKISRKFKIPELNVRKILREAKKETPLEGQMELVFYPKEEVNAE